MKKEKLIEVIEEKYGNYILLTNKENYSKNDKIKLYCSKHGTFFKTINDFAYKNSYSPCPKCSYENISNKSKLSLETYKNRLHNKHGNRFTILEYNSYSEKIKVYDNLEDRERYLLAGNLLRNKYENKNKHREKVVEKSKENFLRKFRKMNIDLEIKNIDEFISLNEKMVFICPIHGELRISPRSILYEKTGCRKCYYEDKSIEEKNKFVKEVQEVHEGKYDYSLVEYKNNITKVIIICPIHGKFWQTPKQHKRGEGCPICNESHGERTIRIFLNRNNIEYEQHKPFKDCKSNKTGKQLYYDFFLPGYNLLIEFDGPQHILGYQSGFFTKEVNEDIVYRDKLKNKYAIEKNMELLRIKFKDKNNIVSILNKNLFKNRSFYR